MTNSENRIIALATELIDREKVITLATDIHKIPWSAPVYYVFLSSKFYFFSNSSSQHIQNKDGIPAAASIFPSGLESWKDIRGVQMSGIIKRNRQQMTLLRIMDQYLTKFPFVKDFFPWENNFDASLIKKYFKADLYAFSPLEIHYLDNRIKFGFRQKIDLI